VRHKPQKIDMDFIEFLGINGVPFSIIFTKADKLSVRELKMNLENYKKSLSEQWEELPPIFVTSSETGVGREEVLDYIESLNNNKEL
jgi:GTP-binding protein